MAVKEGRGYLWGQGSPISKILSINLQRRLGAWYKEGACLLMSVLVPFQIPSIILHTHSAPLMLSACQTWKLSPVNPLGLHF